MWDTLEARIDRRGMPASLSPAWKTCDGVAITNAFVLMCGHLLRLRLHDFVQEYDLKASPAMPRHVCPTLRSTRVISWSPSLQRVIGRFFDLATPAVDLTTIMNYARNLPTERRQGGGTAPL
jgi:hypothetical protein